MLAGRRQAAVEDCQKISYGPRAANGDTSSAEDVKRLAPFAIAAIHAKGAVLYAEGQPCRGIFIIDSGRIKLLTSSGNGKAFILGFANPGEILGLAGAISGQPYVAWAQATQATRTRYVERGDLMQVMLRHPDVAVRLAMRLGKSYCCAIAGLRVMGLSRSAKQKVAIFLLDWGRSNRPFHADSGAPFTLTHEEVAQAIGVSRETVSRQIAVLEKNGLIRWHGSNLVLADRAALEFSAAN